MAEETSVRVCPRCGKAIPAGRADCPRCDHRFELFLHSRETVLTGSALVVVILFFITGAVARGYHVKQYELAGKWFAAGERDLRAGDASAALADLRNALVYEPEDTRIQFRLTQALVAEGRNEEARSYLLGMLAHAPSDAQVNLALARIAAGEGNEADALRYYHGAIYGVWPTDAEANRLDARLELCRFLIARNDKSSADGELIALASEIPPENGTGLHEQAGELFLRAGNANRAFEEFRAAAQGVHPSEKAVRGAGIAAYQMGNFGVAERYLQSALRGNRSDAEAADDLETSQLVLAWDPYKRGLTEAERRDRARHDFALAVARLEACAKSSGEDLTTSATENAQPDLAGLYAQAQSLQPQLTGREMARHPEELDATMNLVFAIEAATAKKCSEAKGLDKALEILARYRQGAER